MFYDVYKARGRDPFELVNLAKSYGYDNPGPIVKFPPNGKVFPANASPGTLPPGAQVLVPWPLPLLRKMLLTQQYLQRRLMEEGGKLMEQQDENKEHLENVLFLADSAQMFINMGKEMGDLIADYAKGKTMDAKELARWFLDNRLSRGGDLASMAIPAPSMPKVDFRFVARHVLGAYSISYWASMYAAVKEGDAGIALYGSAAIDFRNKLRIKQEIDNELTNLLFRIRAAQQQLNMPFYLMRV